MALAGAGRVEPQLEHLGQSLGKTRKTRNLRLGLGRQAKFKPALRGAHAVLNEQRVGEGFVHRQVDTVVTFRMDLKCQAWKRVGIESFPAVMEFWPARCH